MVKYCENLECGKLINTHVDGVKVNIQRRRFCFECSPFGGKNTRDLNTPKAEPKSSYQGVKLYRIRKKLKCVAYKGGKCVICGYDKCVRSLHFHHLDPSKKDFTISHKSTLNMEATKKELDKCVLLCSNCHYEVHDGMTEIPAAPTNITNRYMQLVGDFPL